MLAEMPNLALETDDQKIQQELLTCWKKRQHRQLLEEIQAIWQETTATDSPQEWSRRHCLPIGWVLADSPWKEFCDDFTRLASLSAEILQQYQHILQEQRDALHERLQAAAAEPTLVAELLPEYIEVCRDGDRLDRLKEYLLTKMGPEVEQWPARRQELRAAAQQWLAEYYQDIFWPEVRATLAGLPAEQAKSLLQELVQDPAVGIRLLAKVQLRHGNPTS